MIQGETRTLHRFNTPFGSDVELIEVLADNDVQLMRVRIKEGSRFTDLELDPATALHWGNLMTSWSESYFDGDSDKMENNNE
jgi:hypothetical protein